MTVIIAANVVSAKAAKAKRKDEMGSRVLAHAEASLDVFQKSVPLAEMHAQPSLDLSAHYSL